VESYEEIPEQISSDSLKKIFFYGYNKESLACRYAGICTQIREWLKDNGIDTEKIFEQKEKEKEKEKEVAKWLEEGKGERTIELRHSLLGWDCCLSEEAAEYTKEPQTVSCEQPTATDAIFAAFKELKK